MQLKNALKWISYFYFEHLLFLTWCIPILNFIRASIVSVYVCIQSPTHIHTQRKKASEKKMPVNFNSVCIKMHERRDWKCRGKKPGNVKLDRSCRGEKWTLNMSYHLMYWYTFDFIFNKNMLCISTIISRLLFYQAKTSVAQWSSAFQGC